MEKDDFVMPDEIWLLPTLVNHAEMFYVSTTDNGGTPYQRKRKPREVPQATWVHRMMMEECIDDEP